MEISLSKTAAVFFVESGKHQRSKWAWVSGGGSRESERALCLFCHYSVSSLELMYAFFSGKQKARQLVLLWNNITPLAQFCKINLLSCENRHSISVVWYMQWVIITHPVLGWWDFKCQEINENINSLAIGRFLFNVNLNFWESFCEFLPET